MMSKAHWLGSLQVSVARHQCIDMLLRKVEANAYRLFYELFTPIARISYVELKSNRHLVITASACMYGFANIAEPARQFLFEKAMYIFGA